MFFKGEIPFVRLLIPLILGINAGFFIDNTIFLHWSLVASFLLLGIFLVLVILYKRLSLYKSRWMIGGLVHLLILLVGCYLTVKVSQCSSPQYFTNGSSDGFVVKITNEPKLSGDILRFESNVSHQIVGQSVKQVTGKLLIALKIDSVEHLELNYGDLLLIPSKYTEIDPPFNPGEFDFKHWLGTHQIYQQSFINQHQIKIIKHNQGNPIIGYALSLRENLVKKYNDYLPDKDASALASTLILGYKAGLSKEIISAYSKTGTMHVLSVSGMHVGIVFIVLNWILKPFGINRNLRLIRAIFIISVIWFYALITGFSPSVCRAALMLTFFVLGKALNKSHNTYNLLGISAFFLLLYNPYYLLDVGFQLSYLAVGGLIYFHPKIYHLFYFPNFILDKIWSYTALSLAATLATFPISIFYFHQFPLYFLISNLFIVLPVIVIMYAGLAFLFIPYPIILKPLGWFLSELIGFTNNILFYIENLPWANLDGIWINTFQYLLIYLILGLGIWAITTRSKYVFISTLTFTLMLAASISYQSLINFNRNQLTFYSLRKNTAIGYIHHGKSNLISDLNTSDKTYSYSIKPSFDKFGYSPDSLLAINQPLISPNNFVRPNFMQWGKFKVLRWDKSFNRISFTKRIKVNAILISENPTINLKKLQQYVDFSLLLIDGTNGDYLIKEWQKDAKKFNISYHILKKNPALIVKL